MRAAVTVISHTVHCQYLPSSQITVATCCLSISRCLTGLVQPACPPAHLLARLLTRPPARPPAHPLTHPLFLLLQNPAPWTRPEICSPKLSVSSLSGCLGPRAPQWSLGGELVSLPAFSAILGSRSPRSPFRLQAAVWATPSDPLTLPPPFSPPSLT